MISKLTRSRIEFAMYIAGTALIGSWVVLTIAAREFQRDAAGTVDGWSRSGAITSDAAYARRLEAQRTGLLGRLEIPSAKLSVIVAEGTDERTLGHAVGHVAGTALPGEPGNVGLVGHRDTYFRGLEHIRPGDEIRFLAPDGLHRYRVTGTEIVAPGRVDVLDPTRSPALTLVTCYPFHVLGPAPNRFVVRAQPIPGQAPAASASVAGLEASTDH